MFVLCIIFDDAAQGRIFDEIQRKTSFYSLGGKKMVEKSMRKNDNNSKEGQKLKILLDKLHGESHLLYFDLIEFLSGRCEISVLKKKPLDLNQLTENEIFMLICPKKSWMDIEINVVEEYVKSNGGNLVVITERGRKPEHLNKLLKSFELEITESLVKEDFLQKDDLKESPLLKGIEKISLSWLSEATELSVSPEAKILLKYRDFVLGAKRTIGKGSIYLFSCANAFEKKALKELDNRTFINNILKSFVTPEMKGTLKVIERDEVLTKEKVMERDQALPKEKILGYICTGKSRDLFFTPNRVIVAKKGSIGKFFGWDLVGLIADDIHKQLKAKKISTISPDKILGENKRNFSISYVEIRKFDIQGKLSGVEITINTNTEDYVYYWDPRFTRDLKKETSFLVPLLGDKFSIDR